jgi:hypothetical protein
MKETFGFERALALLKEGKKVRLNNWSSDGHMHLVNNRLCHVFEQLPTTIELLIVDLIMATNWELYEEPKPTLRPWRLEEVPIGAQFRHTPTGEHRWTIVGCNSGAIFTSNPVKSQFELDSLPHSLCVHSIDGGKTWHPCGVLE